MINKVTAGAQNVFTAELPIHRILNPDLRDPDGVRNTRVAAYSKTAALRTSEIRRIGLEDPLIDTHLTVLSADQMLKIAIYCFKTGTPESIRAAMHQFLGMALVMRSDNLEHLSLNYMFASTLGDPALSGLTVHEIICFLVDRGKVNRIGHKFVSGAVHNLEILRCPIFWLSMWLVFRFLSIENGGVGGKFPNVSKPKAWYGTPLMIEIGKVDTMEYMTDKSTLAAITDLMVNEDCLDMDEDRVQGFKKRHAMRVAAVHKMEQGNVPAPDQNSVGSWSDDKRQMCYAWAKLSRRALLTLGGTAENAAGQHHFPTWNCVKPVTSLKAKVLLVVEEWRKLVKDPGNAVWKDDAVPEIQSSGGKKRKVRNQGPTICAEAFIMVKKSDINIFRCNQPMCFSNIWSLRFQAMSDIVLPTFLQGISILSDEKFAPESPVWSKLSWLVSDWEFLAFKGQNVEAQRTAKLQGPNPDRTTLNEILVACLKNQQAALATSIEVSSMKADISVVKDTVLLLSDKLDSIQNSMRTITAGYLVL
jgi:hypothetical protein